MQSERSPVPGWPSAQASNSVPRKNSLSSMAPFEGMVSSKQNKKSVRDADTSGINGACDHCKVFVRVKPLSKVEVAAAVEPSIRIEGTQLRLLSKPLGLGDSLESVDRDFSFDGCYWSSPPADAEEKKSRPANEPMEHTMQRHIFNDIGIPLVDKIVQGYNGALMAYGQTSSGKTWSMFGDLTTNNTTGSMSQGRGIIPRFCAAIFDKLEAAKRDNVNLTTRVEVSFMEIYDEKIFDLLNNYEGDVQHRPSLKTREHPHLGPYVEGLTHIVTNNSMEQVVSLLIRGNKNRTVASTSLNVTSSRSHALFTLIVSQSDASGEVPVDTVSRVHLVDLAGSERQDMAETTGTRLKEASKINNSLTVLGRVISDLAETGCSLAYRDSKLTFLLRESLGGNSHTIILATINPSPKCYRDTLGTLRYAQRAKKIATKPIINEDPAMRIMTQLREENKLLRAEIQKLRNELSHLESGQCPAHEKLISSSSNLQKLKDWETIRSILIEEGTRNMDSSSGDDSDDDERAANRIFAVSKAIKKMAREVAELKASASMEREICQNQKRTTRELEKHLAEAESERQKIVKTKNEDVARITSLLQNLKNENDELKAQLENMKSQGKTSASEQRNESSVLHARLLSTESALADARRESDRLKSKLRRLKERNHSSASSTVSEFRHLQEEDHSKSRESWSKTGTTEQGRIGNSRTMAVGHAASWAQCLNVYRIFEFAVEFELLDKSSIVADMQTIASKSNRPSEARSPHRHRAKDDIASRNMRELLQRCLSRLLRSKQLSKGLTIEYISSRKAQESIIFQQVAELFERRSNEPFQANGREILSVIGLRSVELEYAWYSRAVEMINPTRSPRIMFACLTQREMDTLGLDTSRVGSMARALEHKYCYFQEGGFELIPNPLCKQPNAAFFANPLHALSSTPVRSSTAWLVVADVLIGSAFETRLALDCNDLTQLTRYYDSAVALEANDRRHSQHSQHAVALFHRHQAVPRFLVETKLRHPEFVGSEVSTGDINLILEETAALAKTLSRQQEKQHACCMIS